MPHHRILSIDGGGMKGIFAAAFLADVEVALHLDSVANYFDLIAGTSVGGIIAIGLGLGLTARDLTQFLLQKGPRVFPSSKSAISALRLICGTPKYRPDRLRAALQEVFGFKTLADSRVRLLIPSLDATRADIHIYKTAHHPRLQTDYRVGAVDVAMATAAAPLYFPAHGSKCHVQFVDGGLWANNPVSFAVVEGISMLGWNRHEIDVLSIGCTEDVVDFKQRGHTGLYWLRQGIQAAMRGQSQSALGMARHLTRNDSGLDTVFRISPLVAANRFSLDDVESAADLQALGYAEARHALPALEKRFFEVRADAFVTLRTD